MGLVFKAKTTLTSDENEQEAIVNIKDQGCGIDPNDLPFIFDAFHRGRDANKYTGSGLCQNCDFSVSVSKLSEPD